MQRRRPEKISVLIVPEDNNAEPYSFRVRKSVIKFLYVVSIFLLVHMIAGVVFYWKYSKLHSFNKELVSLNSQLRDDNKRVIALADHFYALEKEYNKVRSLLGVESSFVFKENQGPQKIESPAIFENIVPAVKTELEISTDFVDTRSRFLLPQKSEMHGNDENIPTLLPVRGFLTKDFQEEGWFAPKTHSGIDIVAKKGSVIRAAGTGVIVFANWTYDYGNLVIINHDGGLISYYGHNQRILKPENGFVKKGEPIALLGNSGKSSGPHLHFEIQQDGVPVDPKKYILAFNENIKTKSL